MHEWEVGYILVKQFECLNYAFAHMTSLEDR